MEAVGRNKVLKEISSRADDIEGMLTDPWWLTVVSMIPVVGDAIDIVRLPVQVQKAFKHADKLDWMVKNEELTKALKHTEVAKRLGYVKTSNIPQNIRKLTKGQPVYKKGNKYITKDIDGHVGGSWKMFDNKCNRSTYDASLEIKLGK